MPMRLVKGGREEGGGRIVIAREETGCYDAQCDYYLIHDGKHAAERPIIDLLLC